MAAECRTTLCRLDLFPDGAALPEEIVDKLIHFVSWPGPGFMHITAGEPIGVVMYLAREGHTLPQIVE